MPYNPDVKDGIKNLVEEIAQALNARQHDYAEITSYNKLSVWGSDRYGMPLCFQVVVRLPANPIFKDS